MNVIEAFNAVQSRTLENSVVGEGAGLTTVLEQLGIDPDDMEAAMPSVFYEHANINMPMPAQLVAAFAAGAVYTRANHSSLRPESPGIVEGARQRAELALRQREARYKRAGFELGNIRLGEIVEIVLEAALSPAADPPSDDGAGASS